MPATPLLRMKGSPARSPRRNPARVKGSAAGDPYLMVMGIRIAVLAAVKEGLEVLGQREDDAAEPAMAGLSVQAPVPEHPGLDAGRGGGQLAQLHGMAARELPGDPKAQDADHVRAGEERHRREIGRPERDAARQAMLGEPTVEEAQILAAGGNLDEGKLREGGGREIAAACWMTLPHDHHEGIMEQSSGEESVSRGSDASQRKIEITAI